MHKKLFSRHFNLLLQIKGANQGKTDSSSHSSSKANFGVTVVDYNKIKFHTTLWKMTMCFELSVQKKGHGSDAFSAFISRQVCKASMKS